MTIQELNETLIFLGIKKKEPTAEELLNEVSEITSSYSIREALK